MKMHYRIYLVIKSISKKHSTKKSRRTALQFSKINMLFSANI